ncbi:hypothetical protein D3C72_911850 [compost metagenome]
MVAAGGANAAAGASAGVVAAGGANAVSPDRSPVGATPVISAGGGNLIAASSVQVISAGGMNLQAPFSPKAPTSPDSPKSGAVAGTIKGVVKGPGALIAQQDAVVPVGKVYVGLYDMFGTRLDEAVQADDKGAFTLTGVPAYQLLFLRSQFTYNGREYYLSTPFRLEGADGWADLTPISTVSEARFFTKAVSAPPDDAFSETYLDAFWTATDGLQAKVPASALLAGATVDARAAAYDSLARLNAELFKNDIVAVFDKSAATSKSGADAPKETDSRDGGQ